MTGLKLSFITGPHERVMPLIDGRVRVEGVDEITTTISDASVTFWRQLTFWEFEISEMSLTPVKEKIEDLFAPSTLTFP